MLAAMNLLPALPLDGGRILAVLLGLALPKIRATRITSILGILLSIAMLALAAVMALNDAFNPTLFFDGGVYAVLLCKVPEKCGF